MHIQVSVDDELLSTALQASGLPSREAVIEAGLRMLIAQSKQAQLAELLDLLPVDIKHPRRH